MREKPPYSSGGPSGGAGRRHPGEAGAAIAVQSRPAAEGSSMASNPDPTSGSHLIDARIRELGDWRGETLARVCALIRQADPDVVEELKWRKPSSSMAGVPVWSHDGILCTGETYRDKVKLTFSQGAALDDPAGLFNASLEGNTRRAIDLREGDELESAFRSLVHAAAALNASKTRRRERRRPS